MCKKSVHTDCIQVVIEYSPLLLWTEQPIDIHLRQSTTLMSVIRSHINTSQCITHQARRLVDAAKPTRYFLRNQTVYSESTVNQGWHYKPGDSSECNVSMRDLVDMDANRRSTFVPLCMALCGCILVVL